MTREELAQALAGSNLARRAILLDEVDSTSDWIRQLVQRSTGPAGLDGLFVLANHQTAGRGRFQRPWLAPPGKALLFSLCATAPPQCSGAEFTQRMSLAAPVAVCEAVRSGTGLDAAIKYPNDVLVRGRKVAGVLIEQERTCGTTFLVVGIGVNANQSEQELPPDTMVHATSLAVELGREVDCGALLASLVGHLESLLDNRNGAILVSKMNSLCNTLGRMVEVTTGGQTVVGTAVAVTAEGALVLRVESGLQCVIYSGDVRQVRMGGDAPGD